MVTAAPLFPVQSNSAPSGEFEASFVGAVLEHRGIYHEPTEPEYAAAIALLRTYRQQCADNSREDGWGLLPNLDDARAGELAGKAFVMFGGVRPSPAQLHKAHTALYGPLLCEACG